MVMMAAAHLDEELILDKLPFVTQDDKEALLERQGAASFARWNAGVNGNTGGAQNGSDGILDGLGGIDE
jgi:hypothetical protein